MKNRRIANRLDHLEIDDRSFDKIFQYGWVSLSFNLCQIPPYAKSFLGISILYRHATVETEDSLGRKLLAQGKALQQSPCQSNIT